MSTNLCILLQKYWLTQNTGFSKYTFICSLILLHLGQHLLAAVTIAFIKLSYLKGADH